MLGYIILRDIPKTRLAIGDQAIELRGGFRGFHSVPAGKHKIILEGYRGEQIPLEVNVLPRDAVVRVFRDDPPHFTQEDPETEEHCQQLALGGAMANFLWPFPASLSIIEHPDTIQDILEYSGRVRFFLKDKYGISPEQIIAIGVGGSVVEFKTASKTLTFELHEDELVSLPSANDVEHEQAKFDPWLWQNLMVIIDDYGSIS